MSAYFIEVEAVDGSPLSINVDAILGFAPRGEYTPVYVSQAAYTIAMDYVGFGDLIKVGRLERAKGETDA